MASHYKGAEKQMTYTDPVSAQVTSMMLQIFHCVWH